MIFFLKSWYMEEYRKCKNSWMVTQEFLQMNSNSAKSTFSKSFKSWRPHFQKWVVKSDQTFYKIWLALTLITLLRSRIPQNIHKSHFFLIGKKSIDQVSLCQISALRATYCTSYTLEPIDSKLKVFRISRYMNSYISQSTHSFCFKIET